MKLKRIKLTVIIAIAVLFLGGTVSCHKEKKDNTPLFLALALATPHDQAFTNSCNVAVLSFCQDNYGVAMSNADCANVGGTISTAPCTCTASVGICTITTAGVKVKEVLYGGIASPATFCAGLGGTFSATCVSP